MIKVDEALEIILKSVNPLPSEKVKLFGVLGRVVAEDICAGIDIPQLDNSAMDGYAVKASDIEGASQSNPKTLDVIEDIRAGYLGSRVVGKGQAARIMTGATIPQGTDSVVMVENTEKEGTGKVKIFKGAKPGENVRKKGEDVRKGETVIRKGTLLNPARVGLLASLGISEVKVARKPKVAVLATGDEVIDVEDKLEPGKLYSSNSYTLCSQIVKSGGIPKNLGIAKDKPEELREKIEEGFDCDLILTSGGVSVGDYDLVKSILADMGTDIKFWKVAMKPGKPLAFGMISGVPVLGLPGNPVSSMVSFEVFVRPAILKMLGQDISEKNEVTAVLEEDIKKKKDFRLFLRAKTRWEDGKYLTRTTGPQGSGILKSMAIANSLVVLREEDENLKKGTEVVVKFLE